jgi:hypothetical protein
MVVGRRKTAAMDKRAAGHGIAKQNLRCAISLGVFATH